MEVGNPTGSGSKDATQPPSLPLVPPLTDAQLLPSPAQPPKLAIFQQLVLAVERSNAMKKQLNAYWHRIDPGEIEVVSYDEPEDKMPNMAEFLDLPPSSSVLHSGLPLPFSSLLAAHVSSDVPTDQQANRDSIHGCLNLNDILADPSLSTATLSRMPRQR